MVPLDLPGSSPGVRYAYFVMQTRVAELAGGVELTGVLEDLQTGEKRSFSSGEALAQLLAEWSAPHGVPPPERNAPAVQRPTDDGAPRDRHR